MCSHGFIGAICMPSELMPAWMPLGRLLLSTIMRNGGPAYGATMLAVGFPARYCQPVSDRLPPIACSRSIHSCVMPGTCATTQRISRTIPGTSVFAASKPWISPSTSAAALEGAVRRAVGDRVGRLEGALVEVRRDADRRGIFHGVDDAAPARLRIKQRLPQVEKRSGRVIPRHRSVLGDGDALAFEDRFAGAVGRRRPGEADFGEHRGILRGGIELLLPW